MITEVKGDDYWARHSHSIEAGPSGPARSYWDIYNKGNSKLTTLCLHHEDDLGTLASHVQTILWAFDAARMQGRIEKAAEIRKVIGV